METKRYFITSIGFLFFLSTTISLQIKNVFRDPKDRNIQDFIIHKKSGELIIGATNSLWKLSPNLTLIQDVAVGPKMDSSYCPPPQLPCDREKTLTSSYSQGLALDYELESLISCSSLFHGFCQIRSYRNITHLRKNIAKPIVSNNRNVSNFMFVGKGVNSSDVLYIGSKFSDHGLKAYRNLVPHISSRTLSNLEFTYRDSKGGTKISVLESSRSAVLVEFVYSFTYGDYVYFITSQRNPESPNTYQSKIIRLCQNDKYFRSYVEIPVACMGAGNVVFNVAKGGYIDGSSGKLYLNFEHTQMSVVGPSGLCFYNMDEIDRTFNAVVTKCYQGDGNLGPEHIHERKACTKSVSIHVYTAFQKLLYMFKYGHIITD